MRQGLAVVAAAGLLVGLASEAGAGEPKTLTLESSAFDAGGDIAVLYSPCGGENVSPPLEWSKPPKKTKELALILDDPDAPTEEPFVHWTLWRLKPKTRDLDEGAVPGKAREGVNDAGRPGYAGPCPPPGPGHRYVFTLYALSKKLGLDAGATGTEFRDAIAEAEDRDRVLAVGELTGCYPTDCVSG